MLSLFFAVIPTAAYSLMFYWADRYEREPRTLVAISFVWGAIPAVLVSILGEMAIGTPFVNAPDSLAEAVVAGVVVAPVVEELAKALAILWLFTLRRHEFDGILDGVMYGALVGFGFAMTENFFYFVGAYDEGGFGQMTVLILLRSVIFGLNHAFYTGLTGLGFGLTRNVRSRLGRLALILAGLTAAILAHSIHNLGAALSVINLAGFGLSLFVAAGGIVFVIIVIVLAWQQERECIQVELRDEVNTLLSVHEYRLLTGRWRQPILNRGSANPNRTQLYVELALRKRRLRLLGADREPGLTDEIAQIRTQIAEMGEVTV